MSILLVNHLVDLSPLSILDVDTGFSISILSRSRRLKFFSLKKDPINYEQIFLFKEITPIAFQIFLQPEHRYHFHIFQMQKDFQFKELLVA